MEGHTTREGKLRAFPLPFVGRTSERAEILGYARAAAGGQGKMVLVGGEAGVGKSALVQRIAEAARQECLVATGHCPGPGETPPFGPWIEIVDRLRREQGHETQDLPPPFGAAPGQWSAFQRAASLAHWLGESVRPLLVLVEDIQWADHDTLDLARHLAARLSTTPVVVLATYRTDEVTRRHPLWRLVPELLRSGAARILLDGLSRAEVAELMAKALPPELHASQCVDVVYSRTAGLPLFVREILEDAARTGRVPGPGEPLPQTLHQAIDAKLARLPPGAQDVLAPAAVIGERFPYDLLARVAGAGDDELAEAIQVAVDLHVLRPLDADSTAFAFTHALLREALLARLVGVRRKRWHVRVADALAGESEVDPDVVAFHLTRAGDPRAGEFLLAAADRSLRLGELAGARERLERALSLLPEDHGRRPEGLLKLARCQGWGDDARAGELRQQAEESATRIGDRAVIVWARHLSLARRIARGDPRWPQDAPEVIAAQSELLEDPNYQRLEADLFGGVCGFPRAEVLVLNPLAMSGDVKGAWARLRELSGRAGRGAAYELHAAAMALLLLDGRLDEAAALAGKAAEEALTLRDYRNAVRLRSVRLRLLLIGAADRPAEIDAAAQALQETEELAWQRSGYSELPRGRSLTGVYHYFRGDWRGFVHHVVEARQATGSVEVALQYHAGWVLLRAGDLAGARAFVESLPPKRPEDGVPLNSYLMVLPHVLRAQVCLAALKDAAQARAWLEAAQQWPALACAPFFRAHVHLGWARYHHHTGNLDAAWHAAAHGLMDARACASSATAIDAHRLLGEVAVARGDAASAAKHFQAAIDMAERYRFPFEVALIRLSRGRALSSDPRALPAARADLLASREYFARVGAEPTLALAQAALDAAERQATGTVAGGTGGAHAPLPLPDRLTAREAQVAALVALGLTDQEIAARLYISRKTVDRHLRNIFGKTRVSNRAALAAYATRHGLAG